MYNYYVKELARTEAQLYSVQRSLAAWERDGSSEETKMGRAFVQSLQEQIADLRSEMAQCGDRKTLRSYSTSYWATAIAA